MTNSVPRHHPSHTVRMGPTSMNRRSKRLKTTSGIVSPDGLDDESATRKSRRLKSVSATVGGGPRPLPRQQLRPSLSISMFSPSFRVEEWKILPREFFQIDALDLAPRLLGKFLRRDSVVLQITEVTASPSQEQSVFPQFLSEYDDI